jgi:hypothetical protein
MRKGIATSLNYFPKPSLSTNNNDDDGGGGGGYRYNYGHGHDLEHIGRISNEHHRPSRRESGPHESDYCVNDMPVYEIRQGYDVAAFFYYEVRRQRGDDFTPHGHGYGAHPRDKLIQRTRLRRSFKGHLRQGLQLEEASSRIKELEDIDSRTKEEIRELVHKLEQTQDEYQRLETNFRFYLEKSEANNGKKEEEVERWRKKHADLNTLNGQLEDQLSCSEHRQKAAKEHMDALKRNIFAIAGKGELMKVEIKNLQEELKAEQEKARKVLQEVELFPELHRRNQELEHKLSEIEAQYQQANTMRAIMFCREEAQKEHMEALKQKNLKLDEDVKNVQERLRDEQQKADKMLQQVHLLPELKIRIQELEKQLSESEALHQEASQTYVGGGASIDEGEATPFHSSLDSRSIQ